MRALAVALLVAACGAATATQAARQLLQGDPYTTFNEPASSAGSVAAGAPSVNINGVPAASRSATAVPVMGTLAAPLPGAVYAGGYAPTAVGGVSVAAPTDPYGAYAPAAAAGYYPGYPAAAAPAAYAPAAYAPAAYAPAAPAYDPIAAAAGVTGAPAPAAPAPAAPAPAPAAPPPSPPPPPPLPPGMTPRSQLKEQIPANASALPIIKVPEGTTTKLSYVCDISGTLYIAVNRDALVPCYSDNLVNLAKVAGIKGAKSVSCPDNRLACPGNYAVNIIARLNNTLEEFQARAPQWRANLATAASVPVDKVIITDVEVLSKPAPKPAPAPAPAAADAAAAAAPPAPSPRLRVRPTVGVRRLFQVMDTAAVVETTGPKKAAPTGAVEDTAAVVQQEVRPKPKIIVTTTVQPLTEMEAMSVYGTTRSPYFDTTFRTGTANMGLQMIDNYQTEQADPSEEFVFPEPDAAPGAAKPKAKAPAKRSANATDLDVTDLSAVPLTDEEKAAIAARAAADAAANATIANGTAGGNGTAAAKSAAGARAAPLPAAAAAAAAALCVLAAALL